MKEHILRKYEDMVEMYKQLEAKKTAGGIPLYRHVAIVDMVAEKFYLTNIQTERIIHDYYDRTESAHTVASNQGSIDFPE